MKDKLNKLLDGARGNNIHEEVNTEITEEEYNYSVKRIDELIERRSIRDLSEEELNLLKYHSKIAEEYEEIHYSIPVPTEEEFAEYYKELKKEREAFEKWLESND